MLVLKVSEGAADIRVPFGTVTSKPFLVSC